MPTTFTNDFSREVWETTYRYNDETTINETLKRVSECVSKAEKTPELREEYEKKFFDLLSGFKFVPGGRILSNAGTEFQNTTFINCFVGPKGRYDIDSLDGILSVLRNQAQTLKSEGGWGMNFSFIRPRGSLIKGNGVETPGAVKYMELFDKVSDIITAGSGKEKKQKGKKNKIRKGAMMGGLFCWHGDIEEFITAKLTPNRLSKFNISVVATNDFMDKILAIKELQKKNKPIPEELDKWELIFPDTSFEKYKDEWNGDIYDWKSKGYPITVLRTISAIGLWNQIIKSTYERNDPGILFSDIANKTHCWNYGGRDSIIGISNPCQPAWAKVLSKKGWTDIGDIKIGDFIWSKEGWTEVINKWSNGIKKVYKYETESGCCFYGTKNHKVVENGVKVEVDDALYIDRFNEGNVDGEWERADRKTKTTKPSKVTGRYFVEECEVFDITVANKSHTYWTHGLNVSNCGEQMLPYGGCCNLASFNLTQFIKDDEFDFDKLEKYIPIAVRFSDNVNDVSRFPLKEYEDNAKNLRRIGIGVMGWGSLLYLLNIKFASKEAFELQQKIMKTLSFGIINASIELAKEKGAFKYCDFEKHSNAEYFKQIVLPDDIKAKIKKFGVRNSAFMSCQPTGNTGILANNISGGIEPIFSPEYIRTVIVQTAPDSIKSICPKYWEGDYAENKYFKLTKEGSDDILCYTDDDGVKWKIDKNRGLTKEVLCEDYSVSVLKKQNKWSKNLPFAVTATQMSVEDHVNDLKGFAKWIDSSISKTINVPNNYPFSDFENVYLEAYKTGYIKGITTYRADTMASVLTEVSEPKQVANRVKRPKSLKGDLYQYTLSKIRYYVAIGLNDDGRPYECFVGLNHNDDGEIIIPKNVSHGNIVKISGGKYEFQTDKESYHLCNGGSDPTADALTRLLSLNLRTGGCELSFVIDQLEKAHGPITSFTKIIARALKKYVKDGSISSETCPQCKAKLIRSEGCLLCSSCGFSKCG